MAPESSQPRKQRKFKYQASPHQRGKFLRAMLSPQLRNQYGKRNARVVKGDTVEVMRGDYAGTKGDIENVMVKHERVIVKGVSIVASDGTEVPYPVHTSNIMITKLNLKDSMRKEKLESTLGTVRAVEEEQ